MVSPAIQRPTCDFVNENNCAFCLPIIPCANETKMAHRSSITRRSSRNESEKDDTETENNGYVQDYVKILEQGNYSVIIGWIQGIYAQLSPEQAWSLYGCAFLLLSVLCYQMWTCDLGYLFQRSCGLLVPLFSIGCAFYWLTIYLRRSWNTTSIYLLFISCYSGEFLAQLFYHDSSGNNNITQPFLLCIVLIAVCISSLFSSLETSQSALVIFLVSFLRFLSCSSLTDIPAALRPYIAYSAGLVGVIAAKYMETLYRIQVNNFITRDGKIPVIKRRRSSSSSAHGFRAGRRTSLPALSHKNQVQTTWGLICQTCGYMCICLLWPQPYTFECHPWQYYLCSIITPPVDLNIWSRAILCHSW